MLIDYDRVGIENLGRQNFSKEDLGKFKSEVLAHRFARRYGRQVGYCVYPYDPRMVVGSMGGGFVREFSAGLILGCVDNPGARKEMSFGLKMGTWWMDAGNGNNSGQILLGNSTESEALAGGFCDMCMTAHHLPIPTIQLPSLLAPVTVDKQTRQNCAEAVEREEQSPVINQVMASVMLEMVRKFMAAELTWMGVYLNMDAGTFRAVEAEPEAITHMTGMRKDQLVAHGCELDGCHIGRMFGGMPRASANLRPATVEEIAEAVTGE